MARIKYIRVSTKEQNTARQEQDKALYDKIYLEKISGKDTNRPQLQAMLDYVREGDVVEVESYSRLARDTRRPAEHHRRAEQEGRSVRVSKGANRHLHPRRAVYAVRVRQPRPV